jgi:hypothetical protein
MNQAGRGLTPASMTTRADIRVEHWGRAASGSSLPSALSHCRPSIVDSNRCVDDAPARPASVHCSAAAALLQLGSAQPQLDLNGTARGGGWETQRPFRLSVCSASCRCHSDTRDETRRAEGREGEGEEGKRAQTTAAGECTPLQSSGRRPLPGACVWLASLLTSRSPNPVRCCRRHSHLRGS